VFIEALSRYREVLAQFRREIDGEKDPVKKQVLLKEYSEYEVKVIQELVGMAEEEDLPILEQTANWAGRGEALDLLVYQQINRKFGKEAIKVEKIEPCPQCNVMLINDEPHQC
jgi:hypothetical protein